MNEEEKIYAWKPIEGLAGKFHVQSICRDSQGLRIILVRDDNSKKGVLLNFYGTVRSYRESDDLLSMHSLQGFVEPYEGFVVPENNENQAAWAFFKVTNSDYLKWASYQSNGVSESIGLVHYAIWTEDYTIDILSWNEPEVKLIDAP